MLWTLRPSTMADATWIAELRAIALRPDDSGAVWVEHDERVGFIADSEDEVDVFMTRMPS